MTFGDEFGALYGVSLLTTGQQIIIAQEPQMDPGELFLMPMFWLVILRTLTGPALTVSPKFRCGGNATHDDVGPLFTVPLGVQLNAAGLIPIAPFPFVPRNLRAGPVIFEVTQAGVGPTACACDVTLIGMKVGGA